MLRRKFIKSTVLSLPILSFGTLSNNEKDGLFFDVGGFVGAFGGLLVLFETRWVLFVAFLEL